jgi:hypothetical protein
MATRRLLTLREAADRLAAHGVGERLTSVGSPPIARRGPKGEALYSGTALDAWAAALPRRGHVAISSEQARGQDSTQVRLHSLTPVQTPQPPGLQSPLIPKLTRRTDPVSG